MPQTGACDYCGADIEPGTGTMFVTTTGAVTHFCSAKCEKNADLGREPRDLAWTEAGGVAHVVLGLDEDVGHVLLVGDLGEVHDDLLGAYVLGDVYEFGVAALYGLRRLVRALLDGPGVPGDLERLDGVVGEVRRDVEINVY